MTARKRQDLAGPVEGPVDALVDGVGTPQSADAGVGSRRAILAGLGACCASLSFGGAGHAQLVSRASGGSPASTWIKGFNSSVRLVAGALPPGEAGSKPRLFAGVEMRMEEGWKTYWRSPGDDGGLPPTFDWSASRNLRSAVVRYPAPQRMQGLTGTSIGYLKSVLFPVAIEADNLSKPVELALALEYGICKDICVPAEAHLKLFIPAGLGVMPPDLAAALHKVPQPAASPAGLIKSVKAVLTGASPAITIDVAGGGFADLFAEIEGTFIPVAQRRGEPGGGGQRYVIDLKGVEEAPQLAGKTLRLTLAGPSKAVEVDWPIK